MPTKSVLCKPFVHESISASVLSEISVATTRTSLFLSNIMDSMIITEHLPLITARIPFTLNPPSVLSPVTARTEFLDLEEPLETPRNSSPSTLSHTTSPLKPSGSVVFFGAHKETATGEGEKEKLKGIEEEEVEKEQNEADEVIMLIQKPQGEPGRPQCGGYSLDDVLDWGAETLSKVTVC
jgi:hypothetical protein